MFWPPGRIFGEGQFRVGVKGGAIYRPVKIYFTIIFPSTPNDGKWGGGEGGKMVDSYLLRADQEEFYRQCF
jgi:hypothetical protein